MSALRTELMSFFSSGSWWVKESWSNCYLGNNNRLYDTRHGKYEISDLKHKTQKSADAAIEAYMNCNNPGETK